MIKRTIIINNEVFWALVGGERDCPLPPLLTIPQDLPKSHVTNTAFIWFFFNVIPNMYIKINLQLKILITNPASIWFVSCVKTILYIKTNLQLGSLVNNPTSIWCFSTVYFNIFIKNYL